MKLIAFYLPQFHETEENNRWWGKGFTEWTNTRKALPLFPGHYQPKEPYKDYYYDLTNDSARQWQAQLAKKYGIYGFCYYHYWFKGKRFLHKPLDAILQKGEPDLPFCLSWANDPWTRTWTGSNEVLAEQDYGEEADWKEHFEFLLSVFKDKRYIKIENKPLFLIYRPSDIPRCEEMIEYWKKLAIENGLDGIYIVQTLNRFNNPEIKGFDARLEFEPGYTMFLTNGIRCGKAVDGYKQKFYLMDYDQYWSTILSRTPKHENGIQTILGAFIDWDNSARVGGNSPLIFTGATPEKFCFYLTKQIQKSIAINNDLLFINAWNEWGEGTYLEPDKKFRYQYLEAVKKALENNGIIEVEKDD